MRRFILLLSIVAAIAPLIQISSLEFNLGNTYYGLLFGMFVILLAIGSKIEFNFFMLWLVGAGYLSILLNDIPYFFRPYERLIAFILVMGLVGPLIRSSALEAFRKNLFITINTLLVVMVIISFLGIVAGLPMMIGRGGFTGLFSHSMVLGPIAAIATLVAIHWAYQANKIKVRCLYYIIASLAFTTCVATGSRVALVAVLAGGSFYYYKINQGKLTRFVRIVLIIATIGIFSFPFWQPYTERLMGKMAYSEQQGDMLVTRAVLWQLRIDEFKSSPINGVGFAAVDTSIATRFDDTEGRVEPGSSWLVVLSMLGLIGFIPFVLLTFSYFNFVYKDNANRPDSALLGGLLCFFIVHMTAEGYVLSAGSGLFFYFWLLMGMLEQNRRLKLCPLPGGSNG